MAVRFSRTIFFEPLPDPRGETFLPGPELHKEPGCRVEDLPPGPESRFQAGPGEVGKAGHMTGKSSRSGMSVRKASWRDMGCHDPERRYYPRPDRGDRRPPLRPHCLQKRGDFRGTCRAEAAPPIRVSCRTSSTLPKWVSISPREPRQDRHDGIFRRDHCGHCRQRHAAILSNFRTTERFALDQSCDDLFLPSYFFLKKKKKIFRIVFDVRPLLSLRLLLF